MPDPLGTPKEFLTPRSSDLSPKRGAEERVHDGGSLYGSLSAAAFDTAGIGPAKRCTDCRVPNCEAPETASPVRLELPGCELNSPPTWLRAMARDDFDRALEMHDRTSRLGLFYGLLCPAPCEDGCTQSKSRGMLGAVNIHELERNLYQWAIKNDKLSPREVPSKNGLRVAVIGSGVAGLEGADTLNRLGFAVTVFESRHEVGGILRYEIPDYKFPQEFPRREMLELHQRLYEKEGIVFKTGHPIVRTEDARELQSDFHAVLLCPGAPLARYLRLPPEVLRHQGVSDASVFLEDIELHGENSKYSPRGQRILIVGNRDTAADVIGKALRLGAEQITVLDKYPVREGGRKQSSSHEELYALRRGEVLGNTQVERVEYREGEKCPFTVRLTGYNPLPPETGIETSAEPLRVHQIIMAIGYEGTRPNLADAFGLRMNDDNRFFAANRQTGGTERTNLWVAGDGMLGATILMSAGASGRRAALSIGERFGVK